MAEKKTTARKQTQKKAAEKKAAPKKVEPRFKGRVIYGNLNVRSAPEVADGNITGVLKNHTRVEVLDVKDGWFRIAEGWVMAKYIEQLIEEE